MLSPPAVLAPDAVAPDAVAPDVVAALVRTFLRRRCTEPAAPDGGPAGGALGSRGRPAAHDESGADQVSTEELDSELVHRLQEMYTWALPARLSAVVTGLRARDAQAVAAAAYTLAGTSAQLGHAEVARLCRTIAADARRGILAPRRARELRALTGG